MNKPTIAIDFDGVIHKYSKGWHDGSIYDGPMPGCKEALRRLSETYRILIFSTRNYDRTVNGEFQSNQVEEMINWLEVFKIPYDEIHIELNKPICKLFIDDNAYRFDGDWVKSLDDIKSILQK